MEGKATLEHPDKEIKETTPLSPTEFLPQKFTLQRRLANHRLQKQTKSHLTGEAKKNPTINRNGRLLSKRAK